MPGIENGGFGAHAGHTDDDRHPPLCLRNQDFRYPQPLGVGQDDRFARIDRTDDPMPARRHDELRATRQTDFIERAIVGEWCDRNRKHASKPPHITQTISSRMIVAVTSGATGALASPQPTMASSVVILTIVVSTVCE
jgi:hypothetical protein